MSSQALPFQNLRFVLVSVESVYLCSQVTEMALDLASLDSVGAFAKRFASSAQRLDILVSNAGVMGMPERQATKDGFEMQFGTNHLGKHLPRFSTRAKTYARDVA